MNASLDGHSRQRPSVIARHECERCGAEVRPGKTKHFCGDPWPLKAHDKIIVRRYIAEDAS